MLWVRLVRHQRWFALALAAVALLAARRGGATPLMACTWLLVAALPCALAPKQLSRAMSAVGKAGVVPPAALLALGWLGLVIALVVGVLAP